MAQNQTNWLHYVNTGLLAAVLYFIQEKNEVLLRHETTISNHETRITVLEDRKGRTAQKVVQKSVGTLPETIKVKEENE